MPRIAKPVTTKVFGRLKVLKEIEPRILGNKKVRNILCRCACGNKIVADLYNLKRGTTQSCGCLRNEKVKKACTTHGLTKSSLFICYRNMISRCYDIKHKSYKDYGMRGIKVCKEWLNDKNTFFEWAIKEGWNETLEIDRIKNHKGYSPNNCQFVTRIMNNQNKRNNIFVKIDGQKLTVTQACRNLKIVSAPTAFKRIESGITPYNAVTTPIRRLKSL